MRYEGIDIQDHIQHWMMDAIKRKDADRAACEATELAHYIRITRFNDVVDPMEIADKSKALLTSRQVAGARDRSAS